MGYIYKVTNKINNQVYIGQTILNYSIRWNQHKNNYQVIDNKFYFAIRKYGLDNFTWDIVEECDNELLNEREIYWIKYYDSFNNGYNSTLGGESGYKYSNEDILSLWNSNYSISKISEVLHIDAGWLSIRLKSLGVTSEDIKKRKYEASSFSRSNIVYQYDLDGNYLNSYPSVQFIKKI